MAKLKIKVTVEHIEHVDPSDYASAWEEKCIEDGDVEEGEDFPPIPDDFVLEAYKSQLDDGNIDLSTLFESDTIEAEIVP